MCKTVCVHQPDFLPHIPFFLRLLKAQTLVVLDDVQFNRRGWTHRDRIRSKTGEPKWLTVSVEKAPIDYEVRQIRLSQTTNWRQAHLNNIKESYSRSKFFDYVYPLLKDVYEAPVESLLHFNMKLLRFCLEMFDIEIDLRMSSEFSIDSVSSQRLVDLVSALGGTNYITGLGSVDYLEEDLFKTAGLSVEWYSPPEIVRNKPFDGYDPNLSCIDLMFYCGRKSAAELKAMS